MDRFAKAGSSQTVARNSSNRVSGWSGWCWKNQVLDDVCGRNFRRKLEADLDVPADVDSNIKIVIKPQFSMKFPFNFTWQLFISNICWIFRENFILKLTEKCAKTSPKHKLSIQCTQIFWLRKKSEKLLIGK